MQVLKPLRVCRVCGLEAHTEEELELFVRRKRATHGYQNLCKKCHCEVMKEREQRTGEFIEVFRERNPDGLIWCHFCSEEVTKLKGQNKDSLTIHSLDEDHENWNHTNKVPSHLACHLRYHNTEEKNYRWKGEEASPKVKWGRAYDRRRKSKD